MKNKKKNFHVLTNDSLIIFGPPIEMEDIIEIFDD